MNIEHWMFLRTSFKNLLLKLTSFSRTYCLASRKAALNASALSTVANLMAKVWKSGVSLFQIQICICQQHLLFGFVLLTESISKVCLRFPHPCLLIHNITQHLSKRLGHKRQAFCKQHYLANVHLLWATVGTKVHPGQNRMVGTHLWSIQYYFNFTFFTYPHGFLPSHDNPGRACFWMAHYFHLNLWWCA